MKRALPIGVMNYRKLIKSHYYAVDKSLMIEEFLEKKILVTLITRPRRFGKTLNMSMMAEFFDITKDSKEIFKNMKIANSQYINEMNQYPTIFISFAGAQGSKEDVVRGIKTEILQEYQRYDLVFQNLDKYGQPIYNKTFDKLIDIDSGNINEISDSIAFLMKCMKQYYHTNVMLFIDEYDTPFIDAHTKGYYNEIHDGLSSLLLKSLKLSDNLQYAMITGIQRVAKENIFSKLNNPVVYTVNDEEYHQYFGFSTAETKELLKYYDLELNEKVKQMYNGYRIGSTSIYNPWSIINYANKRKLEPYWINTSANAMIKNAIEQSHQSFKDGYEKLIEQGFIETTVLMETSFYEQAETSSLWGLFVNAGYLTIEKQISHNRYQLKIPNEEVQREFQSLTADYINVSHNVLDDLIYGLKSGNSKLFIESYKKILALPSFHDLTNENSYHMIMLGICTWLPYEYEIISNRETGKGRCDILLKSRKNETSYVIEFKYAKIDNKQKLEKLSLEAVNQIKNQQYDEGIKGKVIYIGLAHHGKEVAMTWIEKK